MILADTNIHVSEIITKYEQDERTKRYRAFFQQISLTKRVVPDFILNELELLMTQVIPSRYRNKMPEKERKAIKAVAATYIEHLVEKSAINSPSHDIIATAFTYYKRFLKTHYISFTDSLLLAMAEAKGYTLLTKDERLNERAEELQITIAQP